MHRSRDAHPARYLHKVIPDDAKFLLALPENRNGKLIIFSRGFSGTELTTGAYKTTALEKGYVFAASDEGWNRVTIAKEPEDTYDESKRRLYELSRYARQMLVEHYKRDASRTPDDRRIERRPPHEVDDRALSRHVRRRPCGLFNSQVSQWGSIATVLREYAVIAPRIDNIIATRASDPQWDPLHASLTPPLTPEQLMR